MSNLTGVHLWLIVINAYRALEAVTAANLAGCGLGESDFRILEVLLHKGPLPVNTLGPIVSLTPGSISTAVERLFQKRLVTRTASATDRRVHVVELTVAGRKLIERVFAEHAAQMEQLATVLSVAERRQLAAALKKFGKAAAAIV